MCWDPMIFFHVVLSAGSHTKLPHLQIERSSFEQHCRIERNTFENFCRANFRICCLHRALSLQMLKSVQTWVKEKTLASRSHSLARVNTGQQICALESFKEEFAFNPQLAHHKKWVVSSSGVEVHQSALPDCQCSAARGNSHSKEQFMLGE